MAAIKEKMSIKIAPGAVVCNECELIGDISIGTKTVIHPRARIVAEGGPIIIGDGNLIEEQVQIIYRKVNDNKGSVGPAMTIGCYNVFEVASTSESMSIGDNNVLEAKSILGPSTKLTNGCIIGAMCELSSPEIIPENTVIYGKKCERRVQAERPTPQTLQLDFLTKVLPNYHLMKKSFPTV